MTTWDPEVLARIRHLHLVARFAVDGLLHGSHRSRRTGPDIEFARYKEYAQGDPLRDLDWKVLARTDKLVVRRHEVDAELACVVALDASGDAGTGDTGRYRLPPLAGSKFGYALCLAATLAFFLHRHGEPVGLAIVAGRNAAWRWLPPRRGSNHLARIFATLAGLRPDGRADLERELSLLGYRVPRRSMVALVSDFMEDTPGWAEALRAFGRRRAELAAFHLLDRRELALDYPQPAWFRSPEGGGALPVDPVESAAEFREVVGDWLSEVRASVRGAGARYHQAWTDLPLERVLGRMIRAAP